MPEEQFKRNIAYKFRIGDLLVGKPILDEDKFKFLELGDKNIVRVNVIGNIIDRYDSEGDTKYTFLTLDDGSGQIKLKYFGDDVEKWRGVSQGETVVVIGNIRYFNNEIYIAPEIITNQDPEYLLVRKKEIDKNRILNSDPLPKDQIVAVKDKILAAIKSAEEDGGIDIDKIIMTLRDISPEIINQEIEKFISEGIVFEPRPGRVRYLG